MKKYTKTYLDYFGYSISDFIPCEVCSAKAVDIHHIDSRKMGGDKTGKKDNIDNIMAVCRECHIKYGDKTQYKEFLNNLHLKKLNK
jgi:5-methylcytosine-specific restriction endonuclease McrA